MVHITLLFPQTAADIQDEEAASKEGRYAKRHQSFVEFGWLEGILVPNLLSICGPILFLEFIRIVTHAGFGEYGTCGDNEFFDSRFH